MSRCILNIELGIFKQHFQALKDSTANTNSSNVCLCDHLLGDSSPRNEHSAIYSPSCCAKTAVNVYDQGRNKVYLNALSINT